MQRGGLDADESAVEPCPVVELDEADRVRRRLCVRRVRRAMDDRPGVEGARRRSPARCARRARCTGGRSRAAGASACRTRRTPTRAAARGRARPRTLRHRDRERARGNPPPEWSSVRRQHECRAVGEGAGGDHARLRICDRASAGTSLELERGLGDGVHPVQVALGEQARRACSPGARRRGRARPRPLGRESRILRGP